MEKIPVFILGTTGKMGEMATRFLSHASASYAVTRLPGKAIDQAKAQLLSALNALHQQTNNNKAIIVDFTHRDNSMAWLPLIKEYKLNWVLGTSGLSLDDKQQIKILSQETSIFYAPNFSLGAHMQKIILSLLSEKLPPQWTAALFDFHHEKKLDAPSATALNLKNAWEANGREINGDIAYIRLGDGVSEHSAFIAGTGERLELTHRLLNRDAFGPTLIAAVKLVAQNPCGLFNMDHLTF